ncbi:anti-sigma factor family protein [Rhizohabitans arisaemae]|uniref:anti-sigma factor family protein n=1 Tax=Rhizohabitans arisaemae TaxID=2720610 RepID=UPI0024B0826D|nr:zf-HC2 domain-containing protein [Rhizohabitans arisaemae]
MNCVDFVELVTAYLEDALDASARRRFEEHVTRCRGCERYLRQIRDTVAALGRIPVDRLSDAARRRLLDAFHTPPR